MDDIKCPACGGWQHYRLNDNRLQCALCRKKYTVGSHRGKLPPHVLHVMAESFWKMIPASSVASELGVNSKTLQKYYDLLRRATAAANERYAVEQFGAACIHPALFHEIAPCKGLGKDAQPLFCLAQGKGKVSLLTARDEPDGEFSGAATPEMLGWIYARDRKALALLDLDRIHYLPVADASASGESTFWPYARRGLVRYHGGFRKNFYFFVREMEFRFNNQREEYVVPLLREILQNDRNK